MELKKCSGCRKKTLGEKISLPNDIGAREVVACSDCGLCHCLDGGILIIRGKKVFEKKGIIKVG